MYNTISGTIEWNNIKKLSKEVSFSQKGLNGYSHNIDCQTLSIDIEDCYQGHERYTQSKISTFIYYVIEGKGTFKIDGETYFVEKEDVIEIPPMTEFVFAGKMRLFLIMTPPFAPVNEIEGKENDLYHD